MTNQEFVARLWEIIADKADGKQNKFAAILRLSPVVINYWLNPKFWRDPDIDALSRMQCLGVNLNWLLTGQGERYLPQPGMVRESRPPYGAPRAASSRRGEVGEILAIWQALPAEQRKEVLNFARYQQAQAEAASKKRA